MPAVYIRPCGLTSVRCLCQFIDLKDNPKKPPLVHTIAALLRRGALHCRLLDLLSALIVVVIVGWVVNTRLPVAGSVKSIVNVVMALLQLWSYGSVRLINSYLYLWRGALRRS